MAGDDATGATKKEGKGSSSGSDPRDAPTVAPKELPTDPDRLSKGTLVGRYVVTGVLGEGGMGVVYSAFDPELDRKVAIKLLQAVARSGSETTGADQAWLLREAQALARLSHPNVIAVHDVGTLAGDRVFVAMELVDGMTLRQWLKTPREWRAILPLVHGAGAGLAAAHAAGLVHRDFKPENVLVGGDGRVRVMDFGLARLRRDDDTSTPTPAPPSRSSDRNIDSKSPLSAELTLAGTVVGTPAYMAPELFDGKPADARTDQFAFGVTLYEALFRARPFDKKDLAARKAVPPKIPAQPSVPGWIQRVVMRAIALDPAQRFATIDALLAELARDPAIARRRVAIGGAAAVVLGGAVAAAVVVRGSKVEQCTGLDADLAGAWDAPIKDKVRAAFDATKKLYAAKSYAGLERALDEYAGELIATKIDSCKATRVRGEQTEEVMSLRQTCLDRRLDELRATTRLLQKADAKMVDLGDKIAFQLEPLKQCSNVALLREPGLWPKELEPQIRELYVHITQARAHIFAGNYFDAVAEATTSVNMAKKVGYEPSTAEAYAIRGAALMMVTNYDESATDMAEAVWAAIRGKRDDVLVNSALSTARIVAEIKGKPAEARIWLGLAAATSTRVNMGPSFDENRWAMEGLVEALAGDLNAAIAAHERSLAAAELVHGKGSPELWEKEEVLATTYSKAGAWAKATPHFERALASREASVGADHPDVALMLSNLGSCYRHVRQLDKARVAFARALAIRERVYGKASPILVPTLDNYAEFLRQTGDLPGALATFERAQRIAAVVPGKSHFAYHTVLTDRGDALVAAGKLAEARALFDEAIALETENRSVALPLTQTSLAELALVEKRPDDAATWAERAIAGYEAAGGNEAPELWRPLTALARARVAQKKPADARPLLERAVAIGEKAGVTDLDGTRRLLAELLR